jgi:Domain of unknown function (DUF4293)
MIQRRQTLFLLFAILFMAGYLVSPIIHVEWMGGGMNILGYQMKKNLPVPSMGRYFFFVHTWFFGLLSGINLIAILLYRRRGLQMGLALLGILPSIAAFAYTYWAWSTTESIHDTIFYYGNISPWVAVLFNILAWWYIMKDEELVKSMDRLR